MTGSVTKSFQELNSHISYYRAIVETVLISRVHIMFTGVIINDSLWFHLWCACPFAQDKCSFYCADSSYHIHQPLILKAEDKCMLLPSWSDFSVSRFVILDPNPFIRSQFWQFYAPVFLSTRASLCWNNVMVTVLMKMAAFNFRDCSRNAIMGTKCPYLP